MWTLMSPLTNMSEHGQACRAIDAHIQLLLPLKLHDDQSSFGYNVMTEAEVI